MRPAPAQPRRQSTLWDFLTFERMMTGPVIHLIYWAGLGMIAIVGFGVVGAGVGLGMRDEGVAGWLLAIAVLVAVTGTARAQAVQSTCCVVVAPGAPAAPTLRFDAIGP